MNISENTEIPFQCYFFDNNNPFEMYPNNCTHIMIPKELNSQNCYPMVPIDIPLEDIKNETLKQILLTLETEGKRKTQDKKQLKLFCLERTVNAFLEHCPLETYVIKEEDVIRLNNKNIKCYACLNKFKNDNTVVYHPLDNNIVIHNNCCLSDFNENL